MKNILIIVPSLGGGGQERIAAQTADLLSKDYNVKLIVFFENNKYETKADIININVKSHNNKFFKVIQQIRRIKKVKKIRKKDKPDIVFSVGNTANITNVLSKKYGKTIVSIRSYGAVYKALIDKYVYKNADKIICISNGIKIKLNSLYKFTIDKSITVYNGIDLKKIESKLNEKIDIIWNSPSFISVGRLEEIKGFKYLLKAFVLVVKKINNASLVILGEGRLKNELELLTKELNIENNVFLLGFQENPYSFMNNCDVYVMTSIFEGFGNVLIEAMTCGLPIISTACKSGPLEILGTNENSNIQDITYEKYGIFVPSFEEHSMMIDDKVKILSEAMIKIIDDKKMYYEYSEISKKRALQFSVENYYNDIMSAFDLSSNIEHNLIK